MTTPILARTPKPLKYFILIYCALSLVAPILERLSSGAFSQLIGLSRFGLDQFFLWQPLTYTLVYPLPLNLSLMAILGLFFNAYLLWVIGTTLIERKGKNHLFCLYFLSAIAASLTIFCGSSSSSSLMLGNGPALSALLIAWMLFYAEAELLLLMTFPLKAKWLALGCLGGSLLIDLSSAAWLSALASLVGALFGYLYAIVIWKLSSPFAFLHPLEKMLRGLSLGQKRRSSGHSSGRATIYEFETGKELYSASPKKK
jgi:membrane associated rhomboid family serine protease